MPLVAEEELPTHLAEQTGNESEQDGPLRHVLEVPIVTQQNLEKEAEDEEDPKLHLA